MSSISSTTVSLFCSHSDSSNERARRLGTTGGAALSRIVDLNRLARFLNPPMYRVGLLACFCLAVALLPSALQAKSQATTGLIRGVVRDPTGEPVAGAQVTVLHLETGLRRTLVTTERGIFVAALLPVGTYDLLARSPGQFGDVRQQGVVLRLGDMVELTLQLRPVELEELLVTGETPTPLVNPAETANASRLTREAVENLPNNGRNFLDFVLLTPGVGIVQGADGDELTIGGQRGIFNNVMVDGADFNNPFFGEHRGGQRPAFTFNLNAVEEIVVVSQGAAAEFGRSAGGFVNVLTKSGTNELEGTVHYFGQFDELSADFARAGGNPDFARHQFGFTLGGPIVQDKAFFFIAYDQQESAQTKQTSRLAAITDRDAFQRLVAWTDTAFGSALTGDFGPIRRTDEARALTAKLDWNVGSRHKASLKYNHSWSEQVNGTFDVDTWGRSANGVERDFSHAVNGSFSSQPSSAVSNEVRFQWAREDRPRRYEGPTLPGTDRPFPDTGMGFADGFRFGMPFHLPIEAFDWRLQLLDNISVLAGDHLLKVGGEWNRTEKEETFIGFANGRFIFSGVDGFLNYVLKGPTYVECSDGSSSVTGRCPAETTITGPLLLFLQFAPVPPLTSPQEAGGQEIVQHELALFAQDTWKPAENLTINYGLRWEAQIQPNPITPPEEVFYGPFVGRTKLGQVFPSDGTIPSDWDMFQPRLGVAWDIRGDGRHVLRANAGLYYARIPQLILTLSRTANGSVGQTISSASFLNQFGIVPPAYEELLDTQGSFPFRPDVFVTDTEFRNPRSWSFHAAYERVIGESLAALVRYQFARTEHLFRFVNRNDPVFGSPWRTGLPSEPAASDTLNGIGALTVLESTASSVYHGATVGLKGSISDRVEFESHYTLAFDRSDDDNERDPFTLRYVRPDRLDREWGWSDRDQRHRFDAWLLARIPGEVMLTSRVSASTAQPVSEGCGSGNVGTGERAKITFGPDSDRICPDGTILRRNTLRKENSFFSWDLRLSRTFDLAPRGKLEAIFEVFNLLNTDNFRDPSPVEPLFNFDSTIRSGLGDPRRVQLGARWRF